MSTHYPKEVQDRIAKTNQLRDKGINPYKDRYERTIKIKDLSESKDILEDGTTATAKHAICGRIMTFRSHGKLSFAQLQDQSGRIQICFMQDLLSDSYEFTQKMLDMGDFIGVKGDLFQTKHGETTLMVTEYELLSKTIRPLPEKWHGIADQEIKYRKRYLDMVSDSEAFDRMLLRTKFTQTVREFLNSHDFIEIETPILSSTASGALAKPFTTHHNALDRDFYLRIAPETWLKKAVAGGIERVYEFAKCFRNEGMDPSHLQEFTMLEYYGSYWNYEDNMKFTEQLMEHIVTTLFGTTQITHMGNKIDFKAPYPRVSFRDLLIKDCGIDIDDHPTVEDLQKAIQDKGIKLDNTENLGRGNLIDTLYKKVSRPNIVDPIFLIHHPKDVSPLARGNDEDERITDRFQLVVNTWEIVNAYSELVDPIDQKQRFEQQAAAKAGGDEEAMMYDLSYVEAMEHGMPPMSGWGMGVDRVLSLLTDQDNIKDVVLFPLMKPSSEEVEAMQELGQSADQHKSKPAASTTNPKKSTPSKNLPDENTKRFIAVLNKKVEPGKLMNALGHITAGLAANGVSTEEMCFLQYQDQDGGEHPNISHFPFIILRADNSNKIRKVREEAINRSIPFGDFTSTMTVGTSQDQQDATGASPEADLEYYGIVLFGTTDELKEFTGKFSLYK
jgi:lysyl-tRNA synthetase class 2